MILGDLAQTVGEKIGMTDAATLALIKKWAGRRHDMICRHALWRDLLNLYTFSVTAAQEEVILPPQIANVVGAKYDQTNLLPADQVFLFIADPGIWERTGRAFRFTQPPSIATRVHPSSEKVALVSASAADTAIEVSLVGELDGEEMRETLTLNGTSAVQSANSYDVLYSAAKEETAGLVTISGVTSLATLGRIAADETARRYARLRLLETPRDALTLVVLGKRKVPILTNDSDETAFDGMNDALEAFTLGDAYEWQRQTEDAADKRAEAMAMLAEMKAALIYQDASLPQIIPWDGPGEPTELPGKGYL
jgi:hypothetical protein